MHTAELVPAQLTSARCSDDSNASLLHLADVSCAGTNSAVCTLEGYFGYDQSSGMSNFQVYVSSADGAMTLWACNGGAPTTGNATWIQRNFTYKFEYFQVNSCGDSVTGLTPAAVSYVSVR